MPEPTYRHVKTRMDQGILVLTLDIPELHGDQMADELREDFLAAIDATGAKKVVLDCQRLGFMSSVGFRPLLSLRRKVQETSGQLVFCNLGPAITDVFQTTRMISTSRSSVAPFDVEPDVASAIARLNAAEK